MSRVDDELTRRFHRAERPVGDDGLFEELERRRSHRERVRRVQAGALVFAVLVGTITGFLALRSVFEEGPTDIGTTPLPSNGDIVFVADADDGRIHVFASALDGSGRRQLTDGGSLDSDAVVSPDGRTVAFARGIGPDRATIATVPIEGGPISWETAEFSDVTDPAWSPDGSRIAFISHTAEAEARLYVAEVGTDKARHIAIDAEEPAHPTWSPDGTKIAVAAYQDLDPSSPAADLAILGVDDGSLQWLEPIVDDGDEQAPAWSPDGSLIAFLRPGSEGHDVWTMSTDGRSATLVATAVDAQLLNDLDWAPDGTSLLVSDGDWVYRVDATPDGDPRDNFDQLFPGFSPSWQPIPAGKDGATPEPSSSPSPKAGRDLGLGFPLCHVERLSVYWYGDGTKGAAWTGARQSPDGRCPEEGTGDYVVAADLDGDGVAEPGGMGFLSSCLFCRPYAATDLDADGVLELVVLQEASTTPSFSLFEVSLPTSERSPGIYNLSVAPPGHPEAGIRPNEPLRISTGGDEGFAGWVGCDGRGGELILQLTWRSHPIEGGVQDVHETDLVLRSGIFVVVGSRDYELPRGAPVARATDEAACGVDWQI